MIVLGNTSDEKGSQLEILISIILDLIGYKNITTNIILTGGEEIDVIADIETPGLLNKNIQKIFCECKAYRDKIDMNDWLKFLGKLYTRNISGKEKYKAYMIALSGANGNVLGHYDDLKEKTKDIELIAVNDLIKILATHGKVSNTLEVENYIKRNTSRIFSSIELAYFNKTFYWLVMFENEEFSLITAKCERIEKSESVINLVAAAIKTNNDRFIDLIEERKQKENLINGFQLAISILFSKTILNLNELEIEYNDYLDKIIEILNELKIIKKQGNVLLLTQKIISPDKLIKIITKMVEVSCNRNRFEDFYTSSVFIRSMNKKLIDVIKSIQGELIFSNAEYEKIKKILLISPSALLYAIVPDPLIINHRKNENAVSIVDKFDNQYFIRRLYEELTKDFENKAFQHFYYYSKDITEIETTTNIVLKNKTKVLLRDSIKKRIGIGETSEEYGAQLIQILILNDAPNPWEKKA
jgi:hypothetical protein